MRTTRRISIARQRLTGRLKVTMARLTGDRREAMQGRSDRVKANVSETLRGWRRKWVRS